MTDFKSGGIPNPDYDSDDVNYVSEKTEFTNDVFVYGKLYADLGGDVQTFSTAGVERIRITKDGQVIPGADNAYNLGSSTKRWANIYSADLQLSNVGSGGNEVDGTEGIWTLQEAENDIFLINRKNGKRFRIKMEEVD